MWGYFFELTIPYGYVLHATPRPWECLKNGSMCGQVVEFMSDDDTRLTFASSKQSKSMYSPSSLQSNFRH